MALPHLRGRVLDFGCGTGNLALVAARAGCSVLALDASDVAIAGSRKLAAAENLTLDAQAADRSRYQLTDDFDSIVSIGLLMFPDRAAAARSLATLQAHLRPGGTIVVKILVEGATCLDVFERNARCVFPRGCLPGQFVQRQGLASEYPDFAVPVGTEKNFSTIVARRPARRAR